MQMRIMSINKLSHSAITKYATCPRSYRYRYVDRIVSRYKSAALYFGSALDEAINSMLMNKPEDPANVFIKNWEQQKDNNYQIVSLKENEDITYAAADFDSDLLDKKDWATLYQKVEEYELDGTPIDARKTILNRKAEIGWSNLTSNERKYFNLTNWLCLRQKGLLMLEGYKTKIAPILKEVLTVQKHVQLVNESGDIIQGYIDLVARLEDGKVYVLDNKTSAREYEENSVVTSPQLGLYKVILNEWAADPNNDWKHHIDGAGFLVMRKGIKKDIKKQCKSCGYIADDGAKHKTCNNEINGVRCNGSWDRQVKFDTEVQIILDVVPDNVLDLVVENVNDINAAIKTNIFPRNLGSCKTGYGFCEYYGKCWANSDKDLIQLQEKKDVK